MQQRCKGNATRNPEIYSGLECGFASFAEFREFALAHGFSKKYNSPDRIDTAFGYLPWNIRFVDPETNTHAPLLAYNKRRRELTGLELSYSSRSVTQFAYFDDVPF